MGRRLYWKIMAQQVRDNATGMTLSFTHEKSADILGDRMTTAVLNVVGRNRERIATFRFPAGEWDRRTELTSLLAAAIAAEHGEDQSAPHSDRGVGEE